MYSPYPSTLRYLMPLLLGFNINFLFSLTSKLKWDRLLGELSYPIYISHMLILTTFHTVNSKYTLVTNPNFEILITSSIIIIFSIILNNYIESLVNKLRWQYFAN